MSVIYVVNLLDRIAQPYFIFTSLCLVQFSLTATQISASGNGTEMLSVDLLLNGVSVMPKSI